MKKLNVKPLVISALTAVAFGAIGVGTTFALFTDNAETHISIGSGKVNVGLTASDLVLYSAKADTGGSLIDENGAKYVYEEKTAGLFTNGGTASLTGNILTLNKVTPGDRVTFNVALADQSNVNIKYRLVLNTVKAEGEADKFLAKGLEVTTDLLSGTSTKYSKLEKYVSTWTYHEYNPSDLLSGTYHFDIALPITAGNEYQDKSVEYYISVEAVQGNAVTNDDDAGTFYFLDDAETVVANTPTVLEASNSDNSISVKTTIPADGGLEAGQQVDLVVSSLDVQSGTTSSVLNFDVSLFVDGEKATSFNGKNIAVEVKVGSGLDILHVYHNGTEITSYSYDMDTGVVSFSTTTFSPFSVEYKEHEPNTTYSFSDSYPAGDHWVHEIKNKFDFENIMRHIKKAESGLISEELANEKTVYLIKNDIDFEGSIYSTFADADFATFTGKLVGKSPTEGGKITLSNITSNVLRNLTRSTNAFCLFGKIKNAEFKNIKLSNMVLSNSGAKYAGIIGVGWESVTVDSHTYMKFENMEVDSTCSVSGLASLGAYVGAATKITDVSFKDCINRANINGTSTNVGGFVGVVSQRGNETTQTSSLEFKNCKNYGNVTGTNYLASFVGNPTNRKFIVSDSENHGNVYSLTEVAAEYAQVGVLFGGGNVNISTAFDVCNVNFVNTGTLYVKPINNVKQDIISVGQEYYLISHNYEYHIVDANEVAITANNYADKVVELSNIANIALSFDENNTLVGSMPNVEHDRVVINIRQHGLRIATTQYWQYEYQGQIYQTNEYGGPQQSETHEYSAELVYNSVSEITIKKVMQCGYFIPDGANAPQASYNAGFETYKLNDSLLGNEAYTNGYHANGNVGYMVITNSNVTDKYLAICDWRNEILYEVTAYKGSSIVGSGKISRGRGSGDSTHLTAISL